MAEGVHGLPEGLALKLACHLKSLDAQAPYICAQCLAPIRHKEKCYNGSCSKQGDHSLIVDVQRHELICVSPCEDYVYLDTFDRAIQLVHAAKESVQRGVALNEPTFGPAYQILTKRRRLQEQALISQRGLEACSFSNGMLGKEFSQAQSVDGLPLGLRGLNNLGNTCFMNCVLQALIHAPLMRNYFLGDGHNPAHCEVEEGKPCLGCQMDAVFNQVFSGDRQPFSPADFLFSWWTVADHLAEYQQQDAHEFYLSALSALCPAIIKPPPGLQLGSIKDAAGATPSHMTLPPAANGSQDTARAKLQDNNAPARSGAWSLLQQQAMTISEACTVAPDVPQTMQSQPGQLPTLFPLPPSQQQTAHAPLQRQLLHGHLQSSVMADTRKESEAASSPNGSDNMQQGTEGVQPEHVHGLKQDGTQSLVDAVFRGTLRSDVTCTACGFTSTAYDPFLDISLDLLPMLEAAKHQEAQLTEMRACSQANTAAATGTTGAAASVFEDGRSMLSQPSVSHPSSSTPSLSGMTDAFSGVEGASMAGPSKHAPGAIAGAGSYKAGTGLKSPSTAAQSLFAAPSQQEQQQLDQGSANVSSSPNKQDQRDCGRPQKQPGSGTKRAALEAFGDNNTLLQHASKSKVQPTLQVPGKGQQEAGATPDAATMQQPSGTSHLPTHARTYTDVQDQATVEFMSSDDEVITSPAQGMPRDLEQPHHQVSRMQQKQQQQAHAVHCAFEESSGAEGSGSGSGAGSLLGAKVQGGVTGGLQQQQQPSQRCHSQTCSMQGEGGDGLEPVLSSLLAHPHQLLTNEYQPEAPMPHVSAHTVAQSEVGHSQEQSPGNDTAHGKGAKGMNSGSKGRASTKQRPAVKSPAAPRVSTRYGECHTCLNRYMKKACLRNKAMQDGDAQMVGSSAAGSPFPDMVEGGATQAAASPSAPPPIPLPPPHTLMHTFPANRVNRSPSPLAASSAAAAAAAAATAAAEAAAAAAMRPYDLPHAHAPARQPASHQQGPGHPQPLAHRLQHHQYHAHCGAYGGRTAHGPPAPLQPPLGLPPISSLPGSSPAQGTTHVQRSMQAGVKAGPAHLGHGATFENGEGVADKIGMASGTQQVSIVSNGLPPRHPSRGGPLQKHVGNAEGKGAPTVAAAAAAAAAHSGASTEVEGRHCALARGHAGSGKGKIGSKGLSSSTKQHQKQQIARSAGPSPARTVNQAPQAGIDAQAGASPAITLASCLQHYVQPEMLTSSASWVCSCCRCPRPAVKQMSILRLPPVLCLHVKRFEYASHSYRMVRKLQTPLGFPTRDFDMAPFLTSTVLRKRYNSRGSCPMVNVTSQGLHPTHTAQPPASADARPDLAQPAQELQGQQARAAAASEVPFPCKQEKQEGVGGAHAHAHAHAHAGAQDCASLPQSSRYHLSTVICHKGDITGGHYVAYVRNMGAWFRCDDAWVTLVSEEEVAQCQAYMLFFLQDAFC